MQRKLASIQCVQALLPIPGADAIELAQINGWQCVVKKGEFAVGDLGVYFEIDAVPPDRELFAFLWKGHDKRPNSARVRTMRLRGALSQGLLTPIRDLPEVAGCAVGEDVSLLLGVTKYEPPPPDGMGDYGGPFPALVVKTDEMRVQSHPELIDELRGRPYVATLKCDGTSSTFCMWEDRFQACGRNFAIAESDNLYWRVARKYNLPDIMANYPNLALQGEIVGPGIQKNHMGLKEIQLRAFNVYDMRAARHLDHAECMDFYREVNVPYAPIVEAGESFGHTMDTLLALAEGKYEGTSNEREGIVIRPQTYVFSPTLGGRLSVKAINNKFLLKGGD